VERKEASKELATPLLPLATRAVKKRAKGKAKRKAKTKAKRRARTRAKTKKGKRANPRVDPIWAKLEVNSKEKEKAQLEPSSLRPGPAGERSNSRLT
jgi:hypothetical protein